MNPDIIRNEKHFWWKEIYPENKKKTYKEQNAAGMLFQHVAVSLP